MTGSGTEQTYEYFFENVVMFSKTILFPKLILFFKLVFSTHHLWRKYFQIDQKFNSDQKSFTTSQKSNGHTFSVLLKEVYVLEKV